MNFFLDCGSLPKVMVAKNATKRPMTVAIFMMKDAVGKKMMMVMCSKSTLSKWKGKSPRE